MVFVNINGFPQDERTIKAQHIKTFLRAQHAHTIGIIETKQNTRAITESQTIYEQTFGWWRRRHLIQASNELEPSRRYLPGGTAQLSIPVKDPRKLGRWVWTHYRGKGQGTERVSLVVVTAYRPVANKQDIGSVWNQHKERLLKDGINSDPRDQFFIDLGNEVQKWIDSGAQVAVGIDANEDISSTSLIEEFQNIRLYSLFDTKFGRDLPPTCSRGSKPIDGIFVAQTLRYACRCGIQPLQPFTDHRAVWMDLDYFVAFGFQRSNDLQPRVLQRLQPEKPLILAAFLQKFKDEAFLLNKADELLVQLEQAPPHTRQWLLDKIQSIRHKAITRADRACRKVRAGAISYHPDNVPPLMQAGYYWKAILRKGGK